MIQIKRFNESMIDEVVYLWNRDVASVEIYAEFTNERFKDVFLNNPHYNPDGSLVCVDEEKIVAYGNACFRKGEEFNGATPGFINMLFVRKEYQRQGIGTKLLNALEDFLKQNGKKIVRNYFGSPINLKWYVPGYDKHEHAGAPAVPFNTPYYFLLLANGYNVNGQHDGFHINLENFNMPEAVVEKIKENEKEGYYITHYDKTKHYGFDEMFDALGHDGFRNAVHSELKKENPDPLLIVEKDGEILGFTGPVRTEKTGRAYLSGVAIHPKAQKRGLGKTMFCKLCEESKNNGAKYMTLFTGSENRARNIYLYAGLRIVRSFVVMRKEL